MQGSIMASYQLHTYGLGEGVKGIAPPDSPRRKVVNLSVSATTKPETGRLWFTYYTSDPEFPAPSPSANQQEAMEIFEKTISGAGWQISANGRKVARG